MNILTCSRKLCKKYSRFFVEKMFLGKNDLSIEVFKLYPHMYFEIFYKCGYLVKTENWPTFL